MSSKRTKTISSETKKLIIELCEKQIHSVK